MEINKLFLNNLKSSTLKQSFRGIVFNGLSILFSVFQIVILLKYLGKENYGIWVTIYSICNWISFLDGGLGNGVRNQLTKSLVSKDFEKSKSIITTGYVSIFILLVGFYSIILIAHLFIDWNTILSDDSLNYTGFALFVFGFFLFQMVTKLISKIYFSFERASSSFLIPAVSNLIILLFVYILYYFNIGNSLWNVGLVFSIIPIIIFITFSLHFFIFIKPEFQPKFRYFNKAHVNSILSQGFLYFLIQMSAGILQAIAPIFITLWFTLELTADYQISMRYYSVLVVLLNIILQTLWTPITKCFVKKNREKLLYYLKIKVAISVTFLLVLAFMWLISKFIYIIWLGDEVNISQHLNTICAIFVGSLILSKSFTNFLNATGNIKLQAIISIGIIILYYPLIYASVKIFDFGIAGLILTPTLFFVIQSIIAVFQLRKLT